MARRSSYASVLAGPAGSAGSARSGIMPYPGGRDSATTQHTRSPSTPQPSSRPAGLSQSYSGPGRSTDPFDPDDLPPYSSSVGTSIMESRTPLFYIPSYLRYSRHAEKLEEKHRARMKAQRDGTRRQSNGGGLSRSSSAINIHKIVPSHRGMTYDIQEKFVAYGEEVLAPLPSRWSSHARCPGLEVSMDGFEVTYVNQVKSTSTDEAATVKADHPVPQACGIYYFEITVLTKGKDSPIGIGFSSAKTALTRLPGWEQESWAYHGDDGFGFNQTPGGKPYGHKFGGGDVIGCGIDFSSGTVFFTKNGVSLGPAFVGIRGDLALYPAAGMKQQGERIRVNLGLTPFLYDIDSMVNKQRDRLQAQIRTMSFEHLHASKNETHLLQELVGQYLAHEGYNETTKAFSQETSNMENLLLDSDASLYAPPEYKEDLDAVNRQRIRSEILRGDIDAALKHTRAYYPSVLQENENIYFKLKCRKFIEMIKRSADLSGPPRSKRPSSSSISRTRTSRASTMNSNGNRDSLRSEITNVFSATGEMDIDTVPETAVDDMNMTTNKDATSQQGNLMLTALTYGRELQKEFKDDPRREVKDALEETFALIAYPDARESSLAHLLEEDGRVPVAEELNSAILVSLGQSSSAALERLVRQTDVLCQEISGEGRPASLLNLTKDYLR